MLLGGVVGIVAGVAVGALLYAGLLRIPLRWFFAATGVLVLFVAAGMASQAARLLIQADVLPSLATPLWDTSHLLPQTSVAGTLLHSLVGYEAQPAGMQLVFYVARADHDRGRHDAGAKAGRAVGGSRSGSRPASTRCSGG